MKTVLLVVRSFGTHAVGDLITVPAEMRQVLDGAHVQDVVRTVAPTVASEKREA